MCPATVGGQSVLASGGDGRTVRVWNPGTGSVPATVATQYPALATAWVADSLAIGLTTGILVITLGHLGDQRLTYPE